ncbi:MAG: hypothetical protein P4M14_13545 [Gammaproteobacteria bacterium]|nr:hypothetical protein [Gammaproteobacteria bacterium]
MLKEILIKTWEYAGKACETLYMPTGFFASGLEAFPLVMFGRFEHAPYGENDPLGDFYRAFLRLGFWSIVGAPYLVGRFLDFSFDFERGISGDTSTGLDLDAEGPFTFFFAGLASIVGFPVGVVTSVVGATAAILAGLALDAAVRIAILGATAASFIVGTVASALPVTMAIAMTAILAASAVISTVAQPFLWLGSALAACFAKDKAIEPANGNALPRAPEVAGAMVDTDVIVVRHYQALQDQLPGFVLPNAAHADASPPFNAPSALPIAKAPVSPDVVNDQSEEDNVTYTFMAPPGGL